jgi:hypothetical protein
MPVLQQQYPVFVVNHDKLPAGLVLLTAKYAGALIGTNLPVALQTTLKVPDAPVSVSPPALPTWIHRVWQERAAVKQQRQQKRQGGPPAQPIVKFDPAQGLSQVKAAAKSPKGGSLGSAVEGVVMQVRQLETAVQRRSSSLRKDQWPIETDVKLAANKFFAKAMPAPVRRRCACFSRWLRYLFAERCFSGRGSHLGGV